MRRNTTLKSEAAELWCEKMSRTALGKWRYLFAAQVKEQVGEQVWEQVEPNPLGRRRWQFFNPKLWENLREKGG